VRSLALDARRASAASAADRGKGLREDHRGPGSAALRGVSGKSGDAVVENPAEIRNRRSRPRRLVASAATPAKGADAIYLPEGRTVEQIVRAAVTKALAEQGYGVVDGTSPHFDKALPVQLDIELSGPGSHRHLRQPLAQVQFRSMLILKSEALTGRKEAGIAGYRRDQRPDHHRRRMAQRHRRRRG